MQKFLKDRVPRPRIRVVHSKVCKARESRIRIGFIEIFSTKTPAVEPLTHRFGPELNPGKVLQDLSGNGSEETWRRQGKPEGRKELLRTERSGFLFKCAAQLLGLRSVCPTNLPNTPTCRGLFPLPVYLFSVGQPSRLRVKRASSPCSHATRRRPN